MNKLIPCSQKTRKAKQTHADILVPPTHLKDDQEHGMHGMWQDESL